MNSVAKIFYSSQSSQTKDIARSLSMVTLAICVTNLLLLTFTQAAHLHSHSDLQCNHVHPKPDDIIHGVHLESEHVMKRRSLDQRLRVKIYYDTSVYKLDEAMFELINNTVLPEAVSYWERALMVRKTESVIRLSRKCRNNQVFLVPNDPHPYCMNACEAATMCGEVQVPEHHLESCRVCDAQGKQCRSLGEGAGAGIKDADFVFYVSAMDTERCQKGMTVAYAAHCQQEVSLDRPIAGHANLCPRSISTKLPELDVLISTVKHEILHALGFSVSLFAFYRDSKGSPLTPRDEHGKPALNENLQARQWSERVIKRIVRPDWLVREGRVRKEVHMMVTPRVVEEVRKHFNCSTLEGAELEDQGGEGTALTHWEKRAFENEAMTGTHTQNPVYSRITLALMEDTGWYKANMEMAQPLSWGRNLGCDFAQRSCMEWMETKADREQHLHPYCNRVKRDPLETECSEDRNSVALCNLVHHTYQLPDLYQNFEFIPHISQADIPFYGGSVALADFCPYIQEFTWRSDNIAIRGSNCLYEENNPRPERNFALELYGPKSKCFEHAGSMWEERTCRQVRQWQHWGSGCYEYTCQNGRLNIIVDNRTFPCYYPGQELRVRLLSQGWLHVGSLSCPSCTELCQETFLAANSSCKLPMPDPRVGQIYPNDPLDCGSLRPVHSAALSVIIFLALQLLI